MMCNSHEGKVTETHCLCVFYRDRGKKPNNLKCFCEVNEVKSYDLSHLLDQIKQNDEGGESLFCRIVITYSPTSFSNQARLTFSKTRRNISKCLFAQLCVLLSGYWLSLLEKC